jgi:hypothetical protein
MRARDWDVYEARLPFFVPRRKDCQGEGSEGRSRLLYGDGDYRRPDFSRAEFYFKKTW